LFTRRILVLISFSAVMTAMVGAPATAVPQGRGSYTGVIDGARYRVEMPDRWNGTLVLYSHGYYPPGLPLPEAVALSTRPETETWLLANGYAVAASNYRDDGRGFEVAEAVEDQFKLLDWFGANIGRPKRTVTSGLSMGGGVSIQLDERQPQRFDGVVTQCAAYDINGTFNTALDALFTVKTLLGTPDMELVHPSDPEAATNALLAAMVAARQTPEGQARLALAGAIGGVHDWGGAFVPKPTELGERLSQQFTWLSSAHLYGYGPFGRADVEARAGGNPSWNFGIDYRRQLARSPQRDLAIQAYAAAPGTDLEADLDALAGARRILPDPQAVAYMYRNVVPRGTTPDPVLAIHTTHDGGALTEQQSWLADAVRRNGDPARLRQVYVFRGSHCTFNAAEEITALRALLHRVDKGVWPDLGPATLNAAANALGPDYFGVFDFLDGQSGVAPPAFADHAPGKYQRPSF